MVGFRIRRRRRRRRQYWCFVLAFNSAPVASATRQSDTHCIVEPVGCVDISMFRRVCLATTESRRMHELAWRNPCLSTGLRQ